MRIRYEIQRKSGTIDVGEFEYTDEQLQEIVDEHVAHEAEATWEKIASKKATEA